MRLICSIPGDVTTDHLIKMVPGFSTGKFIVNVFALRLFKFGHLSFITSAKTLPGFTQRYVKEKPKNRFLKLIV